MFINKAYKYNGQIAFHLYIRTNLKRGNKLISNIPFEIIKKHFPLVIGSLKKATINNSNVAQAHLDYISMMIFSEKKLRKYFYPDYLLEAGHLSLEHAEEIINQIEDILIFPGLHYCRKSNQIQFYALSTIFQVQSQEVLSIAEEIHLTEFLRYLISDTMKTDFYTCTNISSFLFFRIYEDFELSFIIVIDNQMNLHFLISI